MTHSIAPTACTNAATGEVLDLAAMSDEEIVEQLETLEQVKEVACRALDAARAELVSRMQREGATLRLTSRAKLRLHYQSRIRDRKLVERVYQECPDELKPKCFRFDIRPLKTGLNELAKLGGAWAERVQVLYEQVPVLKVEWHERSDEEPEEEVPF